MKIHFQFFSVVLLTVVQNSGCQRFTSDPPETDPLKRVTAPSARQEWIKMDRDLKSTVGKILRRAMPVLMKEIYKKEISTTCMGSLMSLTQALRHSKLWAYQMLDSSGRFPEGFLSGTLTSLGNYEECTQINVNETKVKLQGQYCMVDVTPPLPTWKPFSSAHITQPELVNISSPDSVITFLMKLIHNIHITTLKVGICTPSKCSTDDIHKLAQIIPEQLGISWKFAVHHCETMQSVQFTHAQVMVLYILGIIAFLVAAGTIIDKIWTSEKMETTSAKSTLFQIAKSFSFLSNAQKLSDFTGPEPELNFFYGMIVSAFCWNVMANTFMYVNYDVVSNFIDALRLLQHMFYELVINRIIPLQTFFYISGFMTAYRYLKAPEREFNVFTYLLKKYFRYTPAYALVICLVIVTPTWGSGPTWFVNMSSMYQKCADSWWYNILYINNFLDMEQACLSHTWVIAVAAQLHVIGIIILMPLKRCPKFGLSINFMLALCSLACVALTNVYYDLPPNEMSAVLHVKDRNYYAKHSYYRVYSHLALYCTGIATAYLMAKNPKFKISKTINRGLWMVTGAGILTALCIVHEWRQGNLPSPLMAALYATFSKVAEAAFLAWVTVAFMRTDSGIFKDTLAWRPSAFLAKITFIAYIMHIPIINMVMNFKKGHVFICELEIFYIVVSHVVGTYVIAYVLHMFFEAPWLSLTDVLRRRCKIRTFTQELPHPEPEPMKPMTEKPMKYADKVASTSLCMNNVEKGVNSG